MQEKGEKADEKTACRENVEDRGRYFLTAIAPHAAEMT